MIGQNVCEVSIDEIVPLDDKPDVGRCNPKLEGCGTIFGLWAKKEAERRESLKENSNKINDL